MSTFKSWSKLFVLVLFVFAFAGCCGGGGGGDSTNNSSNNPNTTTKPDNYTVGSYTDTYDIEGFLNGEWSDISMSGSATGVEGDFTAILQRMSATIWGTQITGNTGTLYITSREEWEVHYQGKDYAGIYLLYGDAEKFSMQHIGVNTWRLEGPNDTVVTVQALSNSTAIITQKGTEKIGGRNYSYSFRGTISKRNADNYEITPTPEPDTQTDTQQENNSDYYSNYSLNELAGTWYASNGSGTATGAAGTLELMLSSASATFSNIETSSMNVTSTVRWDVSPNNSYLRTITSDHYYERVSMQGLGSNSWSYSFSNATVNKITIQLLSSTSAEVTETGRMLLNSRVYEYTASYTLIKQVGL